MTKKRTGKPRVELKHINDSPNAYAYKRQMIDGRNTSTYLGSHAGLSPERSTKDYGKRIDSGSPRMTREILRTAKSITGVADLTLNDIAALSGAPDDPSVSVKLRLIQNEEGVLEVAIFARSAKMPGLLGGFKADRILHSRVGSSGNSSGKMENSIFELSNDQDRGKGLGLQIFADEVRHASALGLTQIRTGAAGNYYDGFVRGDGYIGYYVWPRMGYDAKLKPIHTTRLQAQMSIDPENYRSGKKINFPLPESAQKATTLQELMQSGSQGRDWWKYNGSEISVIFDLKPGSASMQILDRYLLEKRVREMTMPFFIERGMTSKLRDDIWLTPDDEEALDAAWLWFARHNTIQEMFASDAQRRWYFATMGGAYRNVRPLKDEEIHHMPASEASHLLPLDSPAIRMSKEDHAKTASYGTLREAAEYRKAQRKLIVEGKFSEAMQMDIDDIHAKFGDKYDLGIKQAQEYVSKLKVSKRTGKLMAPSKAVVRGSRRAAAKKHGKLNRSTSTDAAQAQNSPAQEMIAELRKSGKAYVEYKFINGDGPYKYISQWINGHLTSTYKGKAKEF